MIAYSIYETDYRVRRYAEVLATAENGIDVIALRGPGESSVSMLNGVHIRRIKKIGSRGGFSSYVCNYLYFILFGSCILIKSQLKRRYALIHIHNIPDVLVFMAVIPKMMGAKIVLDIHDIVPELFCQKFNKRFDSLFARVFLFLERLSVRYADYVIAANDLWRSKIVLRDKIEPSKCSAILNYPLLEFYKNRNRNEQSGEFRLVYPGTLSWLHGVDVLIRAVGAVRQRIVKIRLEIYCLSERSEIQDSLVALAKEIGVDDVVTFHTCLSPERVAVQICSADLGVVPKRRGIFSDEAFSTKILDFMAAGVPVIASRTPIDMHYFNESMIHYFTPDDHENLAEEIFRLFKSPFRRQELARNGKRFVEDNNWEKKCIIYKTIVQGMTRTG